MSYEELHPPFAAYKGDRPYVFVNYSHKDSDLVYPELIRLKSMGFNIWYDEGIDPGTEWSDSVATALRSSALFLFFVSPNAVRSTNCRDEVYYAKQLRKPFLSIYLQETSVESINAGLGLGIGSLQAIYKYNLTETDYEKKLNGAVEYLLEGNVEGAERALEGEELKEWRSVLGMKFVPAGTDGVLFCVYPTRIRDYESYIKTDSISKFVSHLQNPFASAWLTQTTGWFGAW